MNIFKRLFGRGKTLEETLAEGREKLIKHFEELEELEIEVIPLEQIHGIGTKTADAMRKAGIECVTDLADGKAVMNNLIGMGYTESKRTAFITKAQAHLRMLEIKELQKEKLENE